MAQLFGQTSKWMYGKILKNKFITPTFSYPVEPLHMATGMHPVMAFSKKVKVFYVAPIFNSYLVSHEENISTLFSADGKTTVTSDEVVKDTLYTFKVVRETPVLRVAEIYKFDAFHVGFKTRGEMAWKSTKSGKKIAVVETKYGSGPVCLQNNSGGSAVSVVLYKKDKHLHFVQVDEPVDGVLDMTVTNAISGTKYGVKHQNVKGVLCTKKKHGVGDSVRCAVREVFFGHYMFVEHVALEIGSVVEAQTGLYLKDRILLTYAGHSGYMPLNESKLRRYGRNVRGVVYDVHNGQFLLSTKRLNPPVNLSVPFDLEESASTSAEQDEALEENKSLAAERKRAKTMNEADFLMDIRAHPGEALPVIRFIQYKIEISDTEAPKRIFQEFLPRTEGDEKDKLCISFVNYLLFARDSECLKTIRRLSKTCSPRFLETVAENAEDVQVARLYFETSGTKKAFGMYLALLFRESAEDAERLIEKNRDFLATSVDLMYKHCENPRIRVEKLLVDRKDVWLAYIRNESGAYLRGLYRRAVDRKWKVADMKEFYRMWLDFEKESCGNVEEVKLRAREYVEGVKKNKLTE